MKKEWNCDECGGEIITPDGGYHVCSNCGLCVLRKFEGTNRLPLLAKENVSEQYRHNQGVFVTNYNKLFYIKKLYSKNASKKKIRNYKILTEYLNLLTLTIETQFKLKELFIDSDIENYKKMMLFIIKTMINLNLPIITEELFNAIPKFSHNRQEIIDDIGKPLRDYKWFIYKIFRKINSRYYNLTPEQIHRLYFLFVKNNSYMVNDIIPLLENLIEFIIYNFKKVEIKYDVLW